MLGNNRYVDLAGLVKTISNYAFEFKVTGLELLAGNTTNKDYLVLKVEAPDNFYKALNHIERESETLKFPGGFKTHISLYAVAKNTLTPEAIHELEEVITGNNLTLNHQITLSPQAVSVFNNSRLLELRQRLRQSILKKEDS